MPRRNDLYFMVALSASAITWAAPSQADVAVSGTVSGARNATVHLSGAITASAPANTSGEYSIAQVPAGMHTVTPKASGYVFTPTSTVKTVENSSVGGVNFQGTETSEPTKIIAGTIGGVAGAGAGAIVTLNGANVGAAHTDQGGTYSFSGLASGTYTLSAYLPGYGMSKSRTVTLGNVESIENNFVTTKTSGEAEIKVAAVNQLPNATVGRAYSESVLKSVTGGRGAYHYQTGTFTTGTPPLGMALSATGVLSGTPRTAGKHTFYLCAADGYGDISPSCSETSINVAATSGTPPQPAPAPSPAPTPAPSPAPTPAPSPGPGPVQAGTSWVYYNGVFDWPGDYSFSATANYADTEGGPMSGPHDVKVTLTGPWGGWLPYAQNWSFASQGYTKLTFSLKPTVANQKWNVYFVKVHDVNVGISIDPANYGPAPVPGQWATYTVPLADLGVLGTSIYKFAIHDETGLSNNTWYVDNVGFVP